MVHFLNVLKEDKLYCIPTSIIRELLNILALYIYLVNTLGLDRIKPDKKKLFLSFLDETHMEALSGLKFLIDLNVKSLEGKWEACA